VPPTSPALIARCSGGFLLCLWPTSYSFFCSFEYLSALCARSGGKGGGISVWQAEKKACEEGVTEGCSSAFWRPRKGWGEAHGSGAGQAGKPSSPSIISGSQVCCWIVVPARLVVVHAACCQSMTKMKASSCDHVAPVAVVVLLTCLQLQSPTRPESIICSTQNLAVPLALCIKNRGCGGVISRVASRFFLTRPGCHHGHRGESPLLGVRSQRGRPIRETGRQTSREREREGDTVLILWACQLFVGSACFCFIRNSRRQPALPRPADHGCRTRSHGARSTPKIGRYGTTQRVQMYTWVGDWVSLPSLSAGGVNHFYSFLR